MRVVLFTLFILLTACGSSSPSPETSSSFTVLSWNISGDAFASHPHEFRALLAYAAPDIVMLDEVDPKTTAAQLLAALPPRKSASHRDTANNPWHISFGTSGGRQRDVIASREPLEELQEFAEVVPYPDDARRQIMQRMSATDQIRWGPSMDSGVAVNGAIVLTRGRRLLVVIADLECCGDDPESWAELKRRVEAKEIRRVIRQVIERVPVDGIVLAGDFNLVSTAIPLLLMTGPYDTPHSGLIAAELYHRDGAATWTWDGRGTPFPSRAIDFQIYGPNALRVARGTVLDTEDLTANPMETHGLKPDWSIKLSNHRPLVVQYLWR
jgi:endonuclease/exonuclease/phosphatase family metal-dependent hydrolase